MRYLRRCHRIRGQAAFAKARISNEISNFIQNRQTHPVTPDKQEHVQVDITRIQEQNQLSGGHYNKHFR